MKLIILTKAGLKFVRFLETIKELLLQHIVFALTGIMAYAIPDVPHEVKTQIHRERLLAKEDKYEAGTTRIDEYDELLSAIRTMDNSSRLSGIIRNTSLERWFGKT